LQGLQFAAKKDAFWGCTILPWKMFYQTKKEKIQKNDKTVNGFFCQTKKTHSTCFEKEAENYVYLFYDFLFELLLFFLFSCHLFKISDFLFFFLNDCFFLFLFCVDFFELYHFVFVTLSEPFHFQGMFCCQNENIQKADLAMSFTYFTLLNCDS
jgi:hypothetical protein